MQKVATKSLSALKSRKEEIIASLQDTVGKEATKKISVRTAERAASYESMTSLKQSGTAAAAQTAHQAAQQIQANQQHAQNLDTTPSVGQDYSLWTSKAFTPLLEEDQIIQGNL